VHGGIGPPIERATTINPPPCRTAEGCHKGTPENQLDLSLANRIAWFHNLRCEATGQWPRDERVLRNAGLIRLATTSAERKRQWIADKLNQIKLDGLARLLASLRVP
jgi:hypothetical protein